MTFKFKTRRARPVQVQRHTPPRRPAPPEEPLGLIHGIFPDSKEEWWAAQWLDRKRLKYEYQYIIFGGPDHFYRLDFLVMTVPLATMVEPLGNHWHTDLLGQDDRKRQLEIEDKMRDIAKIPMQFITVDNMVNRESVEAELERIFREA